MDFLQIVMTPFSWLLKSLYFLFQGNYGVALAIFAVIVKVILFPMAIKGKRGMIQMNMISGRQQELQKKYGSDKARLNEELEKLYKAEGVDRTGGCLWTMLPIFILLPLYAVVRRPLRYLMGLSDADIDLVKQAVEALGVTLSAAYPEINVANALYAMPEALQAGVAALGDAGKNLFGMNFRMFGLDLSAMPQWNIFAQDYTWTWSNIGLSLIPLVSAATGFLSSLVMQRTTRMSGAPANNSLSMLLMGPVMSLWFGFIMPAGMGVYWVVNNLLGIGQEIISGRLLAKDYEKARIAKAERERLAKEEEKREKAARAARIAEEKKAGKPKRQPERKEPGNESARVGLRTYARGRAYDPARYGGMTPYRDPNEAAQEEPVIPTDEDEIMHTLPLDENAVQETTPQDTAAATEQETQSEEE